jgi:AraC family transcriptional regulator
MQNHLDEVYRVLNTFCRSTGIGAMCFGKELNIVAVRPSQTTANDFLSLGTGKLTQFLLQLLSQDTDEKSLYIYASEGNILCAIVPICQNGECMGLFVTQLILLRTPVGDEAEKLVDLINPGGNEREAVLSILRRTPVRSFEKINAIGESLVALVHSVFNGVSFTSFLRGEPSENIEYSEDEQPDVVIEDFDATFPVRQLRYEDYLKFKDGIRTGDPDLFEKVLEQLPHGAIPTHHLDSKSYLRSLKYNYIKLGVMACFIAIESGSPYYKTLDMVDEFIRKVRKSNNVLDLFNLTKAAIYDYARTVNLGRMQSYSKAVKQVLDYIDEHYDEKITLKVLAEHTGLSTYYLSSMIKKETGLILADNINSVRVEKSKELMARGERSLIEIANSVGFAYQNHFSTVFKKITGITPSEYIKNLGDAQSISPHSLSGGRAIEYISEQMHRVRDVLPDFFDAVRVVDPRTQKAWTLMHQPNPEKTETCYDFWENGRMCDNCISRKAYLENKPFFKIEEKPDSSFWVAAVPRVIGKEIYVIELLKKLTETEPEPDKEIDFHDPVDLTRIMNESFRRSRLENRPLSIILSAYKDFAGEAGKEAADFRWEVVEIVISERKLPGLVYAGDYTGDITLVALEDFDYDRARQLADLIELQSRNYAFTPDGQMRFFEIVTAVSTLSGKEHNVKDLLNMALIDLNAALRG